MAYVTEKIESASAQNYLPFAGDHRRVSVLSNLDPTRLAMLDDDPLYKGVFHDVQVWPPDGRREIRARRTPAESLIDKGLGNVEPFLFIPVWSGVRANPACSPPRKNAS
jgi:hypothetical protein